MRARGLGRAAVAMAVLAVAGFVCTGTPAAASELAAERLVDAYSPIVMMRAQRDGVCDKAEEQYGPPTSVNVVLSNPRVRLLERVGHRTLVIKRAPRAADLAGRARTSTSIYRGIRCGRAAPTRVTSLRCAGTGAPRQSCTRISLVRPVFRVSPCSTGSTTTSTSSTICTRATGRGCRSRLMPTPRPGRCRGVPIRSSSFSTAGESTPMARPQGPAQRHAPDRLFRGRFSCNVLQLRAVAGHGAKRLRCGL